MERRFAMRAAAVSCGASCTWKVPVARVVTAVSVWTFEFYCQSHAEGAEDTENGSGLTFSGSSSIWLQAR